MPRLKVRFLRGAFFLVEGLPAEARSEATAKVGSIPSRCILLQGSFSEVFSMKSQNIKAVLFDLDGTLIDSRETIVNAVNATLEHFGLAQKSFDEILSYVGVGTAYLIRKSIGERQDLFNEAFGFFHQVCRAEPGKYSFLYPGVKETLDHIRSQATLIGLVTNGDKRIAHANLVRFGIARDFKRIIGGEENCLKPSACPIEKAMHKSGIDKPHTLFVGDMALDIQAGKAAGILTCGATYGIGKKEDVIAARPDYLINDFTELKNII